MPPRGPPSPHRPIYHLSFFHYDFARYRRSAVVTMLISIAINLVVVWSCGAILYGAFYQQNYLGKLKIYIVDFDGDNLGQYVTGAFNASLQTPNHFKLVYQSFQNNEDVRRHIYEEQAYGAIIINRGATQTWRDAISTGNSSYDPKLAVEMVSESARNPLTAGSHVVPGMTAVLQPVLVNASQTEVSNYMNANVGNNTALQNVLKCPQCISDAFSYTPNDILPAYNAATLGAQLSGAVFLIVFVFAVTGTSFELANKIGEHLDIWHTIAWRILHPSLHYLLIALSLTGCQAAFGVPMTSPWGGRGFVILWMLNWLCISAMGLALEAFWTITGWWILNFFLNFYVVWNLGGVSYSFEEMPGFFKYYYGFPLFHAVQGTLTVVYGTRSHLGSNFGVLVAWNVVSIIVLAAATYYRLSRNKRAGFHRLW
ncbi:hypothetical protein GLOTRDRAFT_37741 [Gloeophyllum trabeum ATCC 11539]|uniref:DUF3533 domain-containing protein n=1 Tax=Gloeophyllum trabeum (strain ATCC 11539 / FP-39264 / Madison 617) TaxID=670483 RepID=S7QCE0_GLOTA|nr:uncharacterized protein GLOTRDRAFT_37741 [Gloeophyllum trabeum ATCC 11539]EPQ56992.1 hypothetical protein GLOTRDRAFT_37741 [Gloeophyllum trabeum ATCC 11539]